MADRDPQMSVVIPTYNRATILMDSLATLDAEQSHVDFEIVVVSDGSTDETGSLLAGAALEHPLTVVHQDNGGAAAARNHGAKVARSGRLVFIDDDMRAAPGLLDAHTRKFDDGADAVIGRIGFDTSSPKTILSGYVEDWSDVFHTQLLEHGVQTYNDILSGHLAITKDLFQSLNGFDENYTDAGRYGNEDLDFAMRLLDSGANVAYGADARTDQYYCVTAAARLQQARDLARADALLATWGGEAAQLFEERKLETGKVENGTLDRLSRVSPRLAWVLSWPARKAVERIVDRGRLEVRVHKWFGIHQGLAYRLGLFESGFRLEA